MAFFFKSKKSQNSALPAAAREITSSHGSDTLTGQNGSTTVKENSRNGNPTITSEGVNSSVSSFEVRNTTSPEPKSIRDRKDSDPNVSLTLDCLASRLDVLYKCCIMASY